MDTVFDRAKMSASVKEHHKRNDLCTTRPPYRQGRQLKAIKVYTVGQESKYLQVQGVPSLRTEKQLVKVFQKYGQVKSWRKLDKYPSEDFTETFLFHYENIQDARKAKKYLDDHSFYGGILHVHYVPEHETVQDTREKLKQRRKDVARRIKVLEKQKNETKTSITESSTSIASVSSDVTKTAAITTESSTASPATEITSHQIPLQPSDSTARAELQTIDSINNLHPSEQMPPPLPPRELPPPPKPASYQYNYYHHRHPASANRGYYHQYDHHHNITASSSRFATPTHVHNAGFPQNYGVTDSGDGSYPPWNAPGPPTQPSQSPGKHGHHARYMPSSADMNQSSNDRFGTKHAEGQHSKNKQGQVKVSGGKSGSLKSGMKGQKYTMGRDDSRNNKEKMDDKKGQLVIKEYQAPETTGAPKFVPRASMLVKKQVLSDKLLSCVKDSVKDVPDSEINPVKALRKRKQDPINNQLRANAFILGDVKGPKLPRKEEELRRDFGKSLSGDTAIESNVVDIRRKVMEFSVKALPPQLKRTKKK